MLLQVFLQPFTHRKQVLFHEWPVRIIFYFGIDDLIKLHVVKIRLKDGTQMTRIGQIYADFFQEVFIEFPAFIYLIFED